MRNTNILNKKGFTLIELLAVIVILAILMLLATPSVLKIMNNAQKSAFETEAATILSAAKTQYAADAGTTDGSKKCYDKSTLTTIDKNFSGKASFKVVIEEVDGKLTYKVSYTDGKYNVSNSQDGTGASEVKGAVPYSCNTK